MSYIFHAQIIINIRELPYSLTQEKVSNYFLAFLHPICHRAATTLQVSQSHFHADEADEMNGIERFRIVCELKAETKYLQSICNLCKIFEGFAGIISFHQLTQECRFELLEN